MVWYGRLGMAGQGGARHGLVRQARLGVVWQGEVWCGWRGMARRGLARRGVVWSGRLKKEAEKMQDKALAKRIMREIWRVQYHHITGEWPDMRDVPAPTAKNEGKEAEA